jgi:hypothetical protein
MAKSEYTNLYLSITKDDDLFIDNLRLEKIKQDKKHYNKTEIVKFLLNIGMDVVNGRYIKADPNLDEFVSQMQELTIERNGQKITIRKTKEQVYMMLIEKGLQHLND